MYLATASVLALLIVQISLGEYLLEVALIEWSNPLRIDYYDYCCDSTRYSRPNCPDDYGCDTRFHICPQPFTSSAADNSCPYGRYSTKPDISFPDQDNITFTFGVNIAGNVPNPMSFIIHKPIDLNSGLRITVMVDDEDVSGPDDLVDILRFLIKPVTISNSFQELPVGKGKVGSLEISYRIRCRDNYYGDRCSQYNCSSQSTGSTTAVYTSILPVTNHYYSRSNCSNVTGDIIDKREYNSLLSLMVVNVFMCSVLMISVIIISSVVCTTSLRRVKAKGKMTDNQATSQLYYTTPRGSLSHNSTPSSKPPPLPPVLLPPPLPAPLSAPLSGPRSSTTPVRRNTTTAVSFHTQSPLNISHSQTLRETPAVPSFSLARINSYKNGTVPFQLEPLPPPLTSDDIVTARAVKREEGLYSSLGNVPGAVDGELEEEEQFDLNPAYDSSNHSNEYI